MAHFNTGHKGQRFGDSRNGGRRRHKGRDYGTAGVAGIPAGCPLNGFRVEKIAVGQGYGHYVDLISADGTKRMRFAHLAKRPTHLKIGQEMNMGDYVGTVGRSGGNYPIHLHFEVHEKINGKWVAVDPLKYVSDAQMENASQVAKATRAATRVGRDFSGMIASGRSAGSRSNAKPATNNQDRNPEGRATVRGRYAGGKTAKPTVVPEQAQNGDENLRLVLCEDGTYATSRTVNGENVTSTPDSRLALPAEYVDIKNGERGGYVVLEDGRKVDYHWFVNKDTGCLEQRLANGSKITGAKKYVDELFDRERTDPGIALEKKSFWRNSLLGRWFGFDDESVARRAETASKLNGNGRVGGGSWFANSWFGRLLGLDDETRLAKIEAANGSSVARDMRSKGLLPGGFIANSWIGETFGFDDASRLASHKGVTRHDDATRAEHRPANASRYIGLNAEQVGRNDARLANANTRYQR